MGILPSPPSNAELAALRERAQQNSPTNNHNRFPDALSNEQLDAVRHETQRLARPLTPEEYEIVVWGRVQQKIRYGIVCK